MLAAVIDEPEFARLRRDFGSVQEGFANAAIDSLRILHADRIARRTMS